MHQICGPSAGACAQGQRPVESLAAGADQADEVLDRLAHTPDNQPRAAPASGGLPSVEAGPAVGTAAIVADLTASAAAAGVKSCCPASVPAPLTSAWSPRNRLMTWAWQPSG